MFSVAENVSNPDFIALADANEISVKNASYVAFKDKTLSIPANNNQSQEFHIGIHTCNSSRLGNDTALLVMSTRSSYHNFNHVASPAVILDPKVTYTASTNWLYYDWNGFNIFYGFNFTSDNDTIIATITITEFDWCIDTILFWNYQFSRYDLCLNEEITVSRGAPFLIECMFHMFNFFFCFFYICCLYLFLFP